MVPIIPHPKNYETNSIGACVALPCIYTDVAAWRSHTDALCEMIKRGFSVSPRYACGGIELLADLSLSKNAYRIEAKDAIRVYASDSEGACYGLASVLQSLFVTRERFVMQGGTVTDAPDKDYRALMVDLGRQWHPFPKLLKFVDICFFYKIKYLHLHFADTELYTLPSRAFPKLSSEGRFYTEEEIASLHEYARSRGVIIVPEFECPGHAPLLNRAYPEIFKDKSTAPDGAFHDEAGNVIPSDSLLCAGSESAFSGVKTLLSEIAELFPDAPYIHIGGDEATISLWEECERCRAYMKKNGISDVYELYSDYVGRICRHVLSLGKTPIVWEGFPKKGSERIPKETIVEVFECLYHLPNDLLDEGFRIINASWQPLYIVPAMMLDPQRNWGAREVFKWDMHRFENWWERSAAYENPITIPETGALLGASLCAWEMTYEEEISTVMANLAALSERTWSIKRCRTLDEFWAGFRRIYDLLARIIQDR